MSLDGRSPARPEPSPALASAPARLAFLVGHPVGHSISKVVHDAVYQALGLGITYTPLDVEPAQLKDALARLRLGNSVGGNVTMPYKHASAMAADWRSESVERCQAASTIVNEHGRLLAYATDVLGMAAALRRRARTISSGPSLVIGAGGAAAAAVEALRESSTPAIVVLARRQAAAQALVERMQPWVEVPMQAMELAGFDAVAPEAALVVNATSVGMLADDPAIIDPARLSPGALIYDYVYRRDGLTALHEAAIEAGCPYLDGAYHLLEQARPAIELLAGQRPPEPVLVCALTQSIDRSPCDWGADEGAAPPAGRSGAA